MTSTHIVLASAVQYVIVNVKNDSAFPVTVYQVSVLHRLNFGINNMYVLIIYLILVAE